MMVTRRFPLTNVLLFSLRPVLVAAVWAAFVYALYAIVGWHWLRIPFLPVATVGTAVAFYVGFKNNASYDRFWEGRKIWGGIVNQSRSFASAVLAYLPDDGSAERDELRRSLVYRHLAWINALRLQLRRNSRFFDKPARGTKRRLERHAEHMRNDWHRELAPFLDPEELAAVSAQKNACTQLNRRQAATLAALQRSGTLDLFHQIDLMDVLESLTTLQGQAERIKNTPFPRQYAEFSRIFVSVFSVLVPFGLLDVFADHVHAAGSGGAVEWMPIVPMLCASGLVTWVFRIMEGIGDASEDPFERSMNDVPMNALCRTIEIDLREMLGETDLPAPEAAIDGLLY